LVFSKYQTLFWGNLMAKPHYRLKLDGSYEIVDEPKSETKTEDVLVDDVVKSDQSDLIVRSHYGTNTSSNNTIELLSENDNRQYGERNPAFLYINSLNSKQSQKTMGNILCQFVRIWHELEIQRTDPEPLFDTDIHTLSDHQKIMLAPWRRLTNGILLAVLARYEQAHQVSASRINSMLVAIRQVAKKGKLSKVIDPVEAGLILDNKVTRKTNATGGRIEAVTIDEAQAVINSILAKQPVSNRALRDATIFAFLFGTGVRVSELLSMDMEDIDFNSMKLQVIGKGDKARIVDIPSDVMTLLSYIKDISEITTGPVFRRISRSDNVARTRDIGGDKRHKSVRLTSQAVNDIIKKRYDEHPELSLYKKKTSAHDFRRGFITHNAKAGHNALIIAEMVGHSDPNSTLRYIKETEEAKKEIAQSVKFDVAIN
jgi:integrase